MSDLDQNAPPSGKSEEVRTEQPGRVIKIWSDELSPQVDKPFHISMNLGEPDVADSEACGLQVGSDAQMATMDLLVVLRINDCDQNEYLQKLKLPQIGDSEMLVFEVTPRVIGVHESRVQVYHERTFHLLLEAKFTVAVKE